MDKCKECKIGFLYDYDDTDMISFSELKKYVKENNPYFPLEHYADFRRSTNLLRFKYCPNCGNKIDWSKIKEQT